MFSVGDYVVRLSYNKDILFRITYIGSNQVAKLKGVSYRVVADAPIADLEAVENMRLTTREDTIMSKVDNTVKEILKKRLEEQKGHNGAFKKTGTVLHIDGDPFYLNLCLKYYKQLDIPAVGEHVSEVDQPKKVKFLIEKYSPDILVLTGHDALNKNHKSIYDINEYRNSAYFIEAVKKARAIKPSMSELVIFAGACQSYFEEILAAGADFAASPGRVLIHALDPVFIIEKIAQCPFYKVLPIEEALENTITKFNGLGGYEILGKSRRGGPVVSEKEADNKEEKKENKENKEEKRLVSQKMTRAQIEKELSKPLFTDTTTDFMDRMHHYMNKGK